MNVIKFRSENETFYYKKTLTIADVLAGVPVDIGAPLSGANLSWSILQAGARIVSGSIPYDTAVSFGIGLDNSGNRQFFDNGVINIAGAPPLAGFLDIQTLISSLNVFINNTKIYILIFPPLPTSGDLIIEFYVIATKIKFV